MFWASSKLDVLESKLNIYEELSREMLAKLEAAVDKISEGNNRIAQILTKHEERIDQSSRNDELILKMFDDIKDEMSELEERMDKRVSSMEAKTEDASKTKWIMVGMATLLTFTVGLFGILQPWIDNNTNKNNQVNTEVIKNK
jgi:CHASE3 domain sensor protein